MFLREPTGWGAGRERSRVSLWLAKSGPELGGGNRVGAWWEAL